MILLSALNLALHFCNERFRLWLKSAEDGLQHDFSWMADKASTVL